MNRLRKNTVFTDTWLVKGLFSKKAKKLCTSQPAFPSKILTTPHKRIAQPETEYLKIEGKFAVRRFWHRALFQNTLGGLPTPSGKLSAIRKQRPLLNNIII